MAAIPCSGIGKRRKVKLSRWQVYVIVDRAENGVARAMVTWPPAARVPGKRKISPHDAGKIRDAIRKLLREV